MRPLTKFALRRCRGWRHRTEGTAAVEFAILGMVFLMIIGGVMDFGHAWYIKQVVTNASREGARYGLSYNIWPNTSRVKPCEFGPSAPAGTTVSIKNYTENLVSTSLAGLNPQATVSGAGYSDGIRGHDLVVTVSATKTWWILGPLLHSSTKTIRATTTMKIK